MAKCNVTRLVDWAGGTWWGHVRYLDGDMVWIPLLEGPKTTKFGQLAWRRTLELTRKVADEQLVPHKNARRGQSISGKNRGE